MKRKNTDIDAIYKALKTIESLRHVATVPTIAKLRNVRVVCAAYQNAFTFGTKDAKDTATVQQVVKALNARIDTIVSGVMGANKQANIDAIDERMFESFYTDVAHRPAWGPGRKLDGHYAFERSTERHAPHGKTSAWLASETKLSLNDWLDTVYKWEQEDATTADDADFRFRGVAYLDAVGRADYVVNFQAGRAIDSNGQVIHTNNLRSITQGPGWGIFVMNFAGQVYLGEHTVGEFHHSSFMSGAPVLAAGEIAISNGVVVGLTNKTGHYKASEEELNTMLAQLVANRVDINRTAVQDPFRRPGKWFNGTDALGVQGRLVQLGDDVAVLKPTVP